jgi:hypothetical protein
LQCMLLGFNLLLVWAFPPPPPQKKRELECSFGGVTTAVLAPNAKGNVA